MLEHSFPLYSLWLKFSQLSYNHFTSKVIPFFLMSYLQCTNLDVKLSRRHAMWSNESHDTFDNLVSKGLFRISCWGGMHVVLFGRRARKKCIPSPQSHRKILVPPSESPSKMGTPRVPEAFQGSRGKSCERGINKGGGGNARKGYFALVCFFLCV